MTNDECVRGNEESPRGFAVSSAEIRFVLLIILGDLLQGHDKSILCIRLQYSRVYFYIILRICSEFKFAR